MSSLAEMVANATIAVEARYTKVFGGRMQAPRQVKFVDQASRNNVIDFNRYDGRVSATEDAAIIAASKNSRAQRHGYGGIGIWLWLPYLRGLSCLNW